MSSVVEGLAQNKSSQLQRIFETSKTSSSFLHRETSSESFRSPEPELRQEDIIDHIFDQLLDLIIDEFEECDFVDGSQKQPSPEGGDEDGTILKHFKSISWEDLVNFDIVAANGSNVYLKKKEKSEGDSSNTSSTSLKDRSHGEVVNSTANLQTKYSTSSGGSSSTRATSEASTRSSSSSKASMARIVFTNGNVYQGEVSGKQMHGIGSYYWSDGTVYQGQFLNGFPTGVGQMVMPDLSKYEGQFRRGRFHGKGVLNKSATTTIYSGEWSHGKREGHGWLLYEADNWYDGQWFQDFKHGSGLRCYKDGTLYKGNWFEGKPSGYGEMIWTNNDYYSGNWLDGKFSGYGEYTWNATFNNTFTFNTLKYYRGQWLEGKREGQGVCYPGMSAPGGILKGSWSKNLKHGTFTMSCANRMITNGGPLQFDTDKLVLPTPEQFYSEISPADMPILQIPDLMDVDIYIDGTINKLKDLHLDSEKMYSLKEFEKKQINNVFTQHLPSLKELYDKYATFTAEGEDLKFNPVMTRIFLWQMYKDKEVHKLGLSLIDTDLILNSNSKSLLETLHSPFEPIFFWQFLMSIVGVALHGDLPESLDYFERGGVAAFIFSDFINNFLFSTSSPKDPPSWKYKNLVPMNDVYALYSEIGEPHTVKDFMRRTCYMRHEKKSLCKLEKPVDPRKFKRGYNAVPICERVVFIEDENEESDENRKNVDTSNMFLPSTLKDFHKLGSKNILDCVAKECPLVFSEGLMCNMDYPLTFLEFYNIILSCIFLTIEKKLAVERDELQRNLPQQAKVSKSDGLTELSRKKKNKRK